MAEDGEGGAMTAWGVVGGVGGAVLGVRALLLFPPASLLFSFLFSFLFLLFVAV
jgi:hypothetical protein